MANIKCGNCTQTHESVAQVKTCYAAKVTKPAPASAYKAAALLPKMDVPDAIYAIDGVDGSTVVYYAVRHGKKGTKWETFAFVERLVGHPGDWMRHAVKGEARMNVLARIAVDSKSAAKRFADTFTCCARCQSPLSDAVSVATGLGSTCRTYFGF